MFAKNNILPAVGKNILRAINAVSITLIVCWVLISAVAVANVGFANPGEPNVSATIIAIMAAQLRLPWQVAAGAVGLAAFILTAVVLFIFGFDISNGEFTELGDDDRAVFVLRERGYIVLEPEELAEQQKIEWLAGAQSHE